MLALASTVVQREQGQCSEVQLRPDVHTDYTFRSFLLWSSSYLVMSWELFFWKENNNSFASGVLLEPIFLFSSRINNIQFFFFSLSSEFQLQNQSVVQD